ncbi:hypothetical protein HFD88_007255 [Aspergillus terreus]|nr:hypothetical protein HFD88_007255 [Aspergillus terreus]
MMTWNKLKTKLLRRSGTGESTPPLHHHHQKNLISSHSPPHSSSSPCLSASATPSPLPSVSTSRPYSSHSKKKPLDSPSRRNPNPSDRHSFSPDLELPPASPPPTPPTPDSLALQLVYNQARDRSLPEKHSVSSLHAVAEKASQPPLNRAVLPSPVSFPKRPSLGARRQSLFAPNQQLVSSLFDPAIASDPHPSLIPAMAPRKIWVRRPGASATLVPTADDALVDELRDQVILKYANSLGRTFDAPDITIRISPREGSNRQTHPDRMLSPEEPLVAVVDSYYPGGQMIEEALIIDIPSRKTPKPSPRHSVYYNQSEPGEHGEYFPLMPVNPNVPTPPTHPSNSSGSVSAHPAPSISVLTTGMVPPLPSPGSRGNRSSRRPPLTRHTTNSPTMLGQAPNPKDHGISPASMPPPPAPSVPTPPAPPPESPQTKTMTPPTRVASPRPRQPKPKKTSAQSLNAAFGGLIEGTVPPINVLIVEDNVINQRLLEAFMKRLSVRWKCAANGEEAVKKWRQGGFHLVLMDIQLPVMNGLDATKEIRRLERLNGIGVFPKTASGRSSAAASATATSPPTSPEERDALKEEDALHDLSLFKSPVIIVALTASSLQSDRHEALAAGCNDFLTKPVRFEWLEQKVTEWGCMQALIDFEGWRKWRGFADSNQSSPTSEGHTSPLQVGHEGSLKKSPSAIESPSRRLEGRKSNSHSRLGKYEISREDSSGSGSIDGPDSASNHTAVVSAELSG